VLSGSKGFIIPNLILGAFIYCMYSILFSVGLTTINFLSFTQKEYIHVYKKWLPFETVLGV
jgi:hypothetical protein